MKKKILLLLAMCLFSAETMAGIGVFPQALDFPDNSRKRTQTLNVINQSDHPQTYRVSMVEYTQDEDGKYIQAESVENSARKFIVYSPKQFTLMPGKIQAVRVARKTLGDVKDGEYVSHLLVSEVEMPNLKKEEKNEEVKEEEKTENAEGEKDKEENSEENGEEKEEVRELSITVNTLFAASIPVTVYKGSDLKQETQILSYKQENNRLNIVIQRTGNMSSRFHVRVLDAKGKEIGRAGPVRIYTSNSKRSLSIGLQKGTKPAKIELNDAVSNKTIAEKIL